MTLVTSGRNTLWVIVSTFCLMSTVIFAQQAPADRTTMGDVRKEMKEAAIVIKNYSVGQREEAAEQIKLTLDNLDANIQRLENRLDEKADRMDRAVRQKARLTLETLRKQRNQVAEWYGGMQHSSNEAWQEIKKGFLKSYEALADAVAKAEKEF
jgi:phosphomevalonate kinase